MHKMWTVLGLESSFIFTLYAILLCVLLYNFHTSKHGPLQQMEARIS